MICIEAPLYPDIPDSKVAIAYKTDNLRKCWQISNTINYFDFSNIIIFYLTNSNFLAVNVVNFDF